MKNSIKGLLPILFFLFLLPASASTAMDSILVSDSLFGNDGPREIQEETLRELQTDDEMDYHLASPEDNLWTQFRNWLFLQLLRLLGTEGAANSIEIILYTIGLIMLIYAILRILKVDLSSLLILGNRRAVLADGKNNTQENIPEIDFQAAIAAALQAREYNKAIRLLYLSALKELSLQEYIYWKPGKTNYQYQQELQQTHLQDPFRQLGLFFEHAWYGNFQVNENHYQEAARMYQSLHQNLQQRI